MLASTAVANIRNGVVISGNGQNLNLTIDASVPTNLGGGILFDGGTGTTTLIGPDRDTTWDITGPGAGDLGGAAFVRFTGVANLLGAANNDDSFHMGASGSIAGVIDGGPGGFDSLIVDGTTPVPTTYTPSRPHSGTIGLGPRTVSYAGLEPVTLSGPQTDLLVTGSAGDDQMVVEDLGGGMLQVHSAAASPTFESVTFQTPSHSLTIDGAGGTDQISVDGAVNLGAADFLAEAESITVPAGAAINGTGQITLQAIGQGVLSASASPAPVSVPAQVIVQGAIQTTGSLSIEATVANAVTLSAPGLPSDLSLGSSSAALAEITGGAVVSAATLQLTAHTGTTFTTTALGAVTGHVNVGSNQTTHAGIDGGARVSVGGGAISGAEPDSVLIRATDDSHLVTDSTNSTSSTFDFTALAGTIGLTRDTQAYVADNPGSTGVALTTTGLARLDAENLGEVTTTIESDSVGSVQNNVSDTALATVKNAGVQAGGIALSALSGTSYTASAKDAVNSVSGGTKALIQGGDVVAGSGGVQLSADDDSIASAESTRLSLTLGSNLASSLSVAIASARNELDRNTEASISAASTVTANGGDIELAAANDAQVSAEATSTSVTSTGPLPLSVSVSLGGLFVVNSLTGGVNAFIDGSNVHTVGSGDVQVDAKDTSAVDATTEISAQTATGTSSLLQVGTATGASIALNVIGWQINNLGLATIDGLLGTQVGDTEVPFLVQAYIEDSSIGSAGGLSLTADAAQQVDATVSNAASSTSSGLFGAQGVGSSGILASNRVSDQAK